MITLYTGTLGSGKSYKMVAELSRKKDQFFVIHNIDGLKEGYLGEYGVNWITYCKEMEIEVTEFFSKEYQSDYANAILAKYKRPILIIIDEAHEWFDRHVKTFKMWLSFSRHLDQEIWLVAHDRNNIPAVYRSFIAVEYRAKNGRVLNLPWFFYNIIEGKQARGYTKEKKNPEIFALYKSKQIHTGKKESRSYMLPLALAASVAGIIFFFWLPSRAMAPKKQPVSQTSSISQTNSAAVPNQSNINYPLVDEKALDKKYAFVGALDDRVVLEDRKTGVQIGIDRIPFMVKLVAINRDISCTLFDGKKLYILYNSDRFIHSKQNNNQGFMVAGAGSERRRSEDPAPAIVNN